MYQISRRNYFGRGRQEVVNMTVLIVKRKIMPFVYERAAFVWKCQRKRQNKQLGWPLGAVSGGSGCWQ